MMRRRVVPFVSYAHADALAEDLLERLWREAGPSRRYEYRPWRDNAILPGEGWDAEIRAALEASDVGLLLLSPAFLASSYVRAVELPALLGVRPVLPVLLARLDLQRHDLQGLERLQLFGLPGSRGGLDSYAECAGQRRGRFVSTLFARMEQRLDKVLEAAP